MVTYPPRGDDEAAAPTLTSLARELGVHVSTVSRALSGKATGVSAGTAEHIQRYAAERGYRSNLAARALRTGRSQVIGMLVPRLTDEVLATVYEGVDEAAMAKGYATLVVNTLDQPDLRSERLDLMLARKVDGVVVADSLLDSNAVEQLESAGVPYVLALRCLPGHISVGTDDLRGGQFAAEHLLGLGHRRIGVAAGDVRASTGLERTQGFVAACSEAGVRIPGEAIVPCGFGVRSGAEAAAQLLEVNPDLTAIYSVSDNIALGVLGALRDRGRAVPDDVALVGYNNLDLAQALPVPLTTVDSRLVEVGRAATATLLDLLTGATPNSQRLEPYLIVRDSCSPRDPLANEGPLIKTGGPR